MRPGSLSSAHPILASRHHGEKETEKDRDREKWVSISVSLTEDHHPLLDAIGRGLLSGLHLPRGGGGH